MPLFTFTTTFSLLLPILSINGSVKRCTQTLYWPIENPRIQTSADNLASVLLRATTDAPRSNVRLTNSKAKGDPGHQALERAGPSECKLIINLERIARCSLHTFHLLAHVANPGKHCNKS